MAAIDLEKMVSRQLAKHCGHEPGRWVRVRERLVSTCRKCRVEFIIDLKGSKRCATNTGTECPGGKTSKAPMTHEKRT